MSSILFENDVKTYGTQTIFLDCTAHSKFENDVKTYGTQTQSCGTIPSLQFENDVKTYGTQTGDEEYDETYCLRMM